MIRATFRFSVFCIDMCGRRVDLDFPNEGIEEGRGFELCVYCRIINIHTK